jgi:translation initiation factor 4A
MGDIVENIENKTDEIQTYEKWDMLDLKDDLLRGIYSFGFENPSQIQKTAIKPIIDKRDVIAQAPSGTGKTGAFTVGSLQNIDISQKNTQVIILAPTHELVKQITTVVESIGSMLDGLRVKMLVGGTMVSDDIRDLCENIPHIIVGTIGRVNDMVRRDHIEMRSIKMFILDEADEMLSGGFKEQVYQMFQYLPTDTQTAIFSATMPPYMLELTTRFMRNPVKITMEVEQLNLDGIEQYYMAVDNDDEKFISLKSLFDKLTINQTIIYVNSVPRVVDLYNAMIKDGYSVACIHSSMPRDERNSSFNEFKSGKFRVLISSDITSRGIDIQQVSTVINFDIPKSVNTYLHRIGRSGRWGRKGMAINFVTRQDVGNLKHIENHYKSNIQELPSNFVM